MAWRSTLVLFLLLATSASADTVFPISTSGELIDLIRNTGANQVPDGGVIEMAPGTYAAPSGGFLIFNPDRSFTIRAQTPGTVFLDGGGSERIFRFIVNNPSLAGSVVFEGLTFRNGRSTQPAFASAMTLQGSIASFIDCLFEDNVNASAGSGAGTISAQAESTALLLRTTIQDNTTITSGGGAVIVGSSNFWCHECQFLRNRSNLPGHGQTSTGGGLVVTSQSSVYLSNSRFAANEAGFAGGALDVKGAFSEAEPALVVAANSTFVDNISSPDPGVVTNSPTAGGVANIEDNAVVQFYNSRLHDNNAQFGGALAVYRATLEIYDSVLRGNFATGRESTNSPPRGGAIFATSDDTTADGNNNRPTSQVTIRDSLIHGELTSARRGTQTAAAHTGGCVYASGDLNRQLGQAEVPPGGTQEQNSARLDINGTAFVDCDVDSLIADGALGGGIFSELAIINIDDSLFIDGNANGASGAGGAAALTRFADATINNTTFSNNFAVRGGGALFMLGADIDVNGSSFFKNIVPGSNPSASKGAAIFTGPQDGADLSVEGVIRNSLFADNQGLPLWDDDRSCGADVFNLVTYENNQFFPTAFPPSVYRSTVAGTFDVDGLNGLFVNRGAGCAGTDKAPTNNNVELSTQPVLGALLGLPPQIIAKSAAGDPETSTESFLAYAWCGDCAELDGNGLTTQTGLTAATSGVRSLMVFENAGCSGAPDLDLVATLNQSLTPSANLSADPVMIPGGGSSTLSWGTANGTFLESAMDQGQGLLGTASGSVSVSPSLTTNYTFFTITEEGGDTAQAKVFVDEEPDDLIFGDGFESGDTSAWSIVQ